MLDWAAFYFIEAAISTAPQPARTRRANFSVARRGSTPRFPRCHRETCLAHLTSNTSFKARPARRAPAKFDLAREDQKIVGVGRPVRLLPDLPCPRIQSKLISYPRSSHRARVRTLLSCSKTTPHLNHPSTETFSNPIVIAQAPCAPAHLTVLSAPAPPAPDPPSI
ncbi:hypothetical protein K488DRAFT_86124 [Vararia minispora EC-137]|uniref:Uncharacterized protein n=1 Tax=Vararia minispora EC-137 TaxID=1314806 RepID=A0ACB8QL92_9AGAM|nr:hypothetical protein K488DRAFT_86124 [Vararia minispora EC-137]